MAEAEETGLQISSEGNSLAGDQGSSVRRKRKSALEMLAAKKIELARLQSIDISKLKPGRQAAHAAMIASLSSQIGVYEAKISSKGKVSSVNCLLQTKAAPTLQRKVGLRELIVKSDALCRPEPCIMTSLEHNSNMNQKWDIATDTFNDGSSALSS